MNGSTRNCGDWYTVSIIGVSEISLPYHLYGPINNTPAQVASGDTCALVSVANSISLSDFYLLNPEINQECTNLELGVAYCVEPVGDIQTYPGYTVTGGPTITVPPVTFPSVNTAIPTNTGDPGFVYTTSLLPKASDTISTCDTYMNYNDSTGSRSDCSYNAFANQLTINQLLEWNPSLSSNLSTCNLQSGYSYCVELTNATSKARLHPFSKRILIALASTSSNDCLSVNSTTIESGTTSTCQCFMVVHGYDNGCKFRAAKASSSSSPPLTIP